MNPLTSVTFWIALVVAFPATADTPVAGSHDPEFVQATQRWLDDDDRQSLPALAQLARDGNRAARLLLARIETTDRAFRPFVANLSRRKRHDLFRASQGSSLFPPSWLKVESDRGDPLARALFKSTSGEIDIAAVERLYALGENEATEHLVRKVAVDGSQSEREALLQVLIPRAELEPYLQGFYRARSGITTGKTGLQFIVGIIDGVEPESVVLERNRETHVAEQYVDLGYQSGKQTIGDWKQNPYYEAIARWTLEASPARPAANFCRDICADDELTACAAVTFGLIGGYYEVIRFDSPLESIIPQDRFLQSQRAIGMITRRLAAARTEANEAIFTHEELAARSQCLADAISR